MCRRLKGYFAVDSGGPDVAFFTRHLPVGLFIEGS
jgi:hypothetical protein